MFLCLFACGGTSDFLPKPMGYYRISLPEKSYIPFDSDCPYRFSYPSYAVPVFKKEAEFPCWMNLEFPHFQATLHISYKALQNDLEQCTEDSRSLVYKHTYKATDIKEEMLHDEAAGKYGILYRIKGNTASSLQFHITDSTRHFLRASLYFNNAPNADSIAPVLQFLEKDIEYMIETFTWK